MAKKKAKSSAHPLALNAEQLARRCDPASLGFETTESLPGLKDIIGQPRGVQAIEFGLGMASRGYNIFVIGPRGTGRLTAIERFIRSRAADDPVPDDWLYVHNFDSTHQPLAIRLPAGEGKRFADDMRNLIRKLRVEISRAFETEDFEQQVQEIKRDFNKQRESIQARVQEIAEERGFVIRNTTAGIMMAPMREGEPMTSEAYEALTEEEHQDIEQARDELEEYLEDALKEVNDLESQAQDGYEKLRKEVVNKVLDEQMQAVIDEYTTYDPLVEHMRRVREDVLDNMDAFIGDDTLGDDEEASESVNGQPEEEDEDSSSDSSVNTDDLQGLRRYEANLLVDHSESKGAPVVVVSLPTYQNLIGRIEYRVQFGAMTTDFTMIVAGALQKANGGFLVVRASDILNQPFAWEALKRALDSGEVRIEEPESRGTGVITTQVLDPAPIPLDVKVVMLGSPMMYYMLLDAEEDFPELFKVKADFAGTMDRTEENEMLYAQFVASRSQEHKIRHFESGAVARIIDYSSWLTADQQKLSTRFGEITDLIHEANYYAGQNAHEVVKAADVTQAITERDYRHNLYQETTRQRILDETVYVQTEGEKTGQINGLTVIDLGDHAFGQPSRITARVYMGEAGVLQIDREVHMTGPIHSKGVLTLHGYLGSTYAAGFPLSLTASLTFEQNYGGVEGDSASSTELYALISALADLPIRQDLAVTGSVDQYGTIQPVGGVTEKIEGFFAICQERGLSGKQGVVMPKSNLRNLMLRDEVIKAVEAGKFHLYAIEQIDQGIELLMGQPAGERQPDDTYPQGTVHHRVQMRLRQLFEGIRGLYAPVVNVGGKN